MSFLNRSKVKSTIKSSKAFIDNITDPLFIVDKNLKIHYINDPALSVMGYRREDVIGKMTCADLCKTPLCNTSNCTLKGCMEYKKPITGQTVARTRDGVAIPVRASCNALYDKRGNPIGGFELIADIRVLDEGFLNNMADAALRTDKDLLIQNINDAALKALGYTRDEVIGKMTCADLCKTPLCNTSNCTIKRCMETKSTVVGTTVAKTKNGKLIPIRAACGVLTDTEGNITGGFEIISDVTQVDEGFLNNMADAAFRTDKDLLIQNINDAALKALGYTRDEVVGKMTCADLCKTPVCNTADCTIKNCIETKRSLIAETEATAKNGTKIPIRAACGVLLDAEGNPSGGFEVISNNTDFIKMVNVTKSISEGDFTTEVEEEIVKRDDAVGVLAKAIRKMISDLSDIISNVVISAQNMAQAVEQISSGNQNLSQRSSEQASSLEEVASTIEQATATIKQNADNAQEANKISVETSTLAEEGKSVVMEAVKSINDISESSRKIGDIISVINEIAFQTNLLALNAAVEAARAGEQGRGFAVVAGEVRNLAQRAGGAAKEIGQLIKDSVEKVERGTALSNKSGEALNEIVSAVNRVSQVISEIAVASEEQRQGIDQINIAIGEMDSMTQQNAALVEETASASEEMANQAQELIEITERFRLKDVVKGKIEKERRREIHLHAAEPTRKGMVEAKAGDGDGKGKVIVPDGVKSSHDELIEQGFEEF